MPIPIPPGSRDEAYWRLGDFIYDESPYGEVQELPPGYLPTLVAEGPNANYDSDHPVPVNQKPKNTECYWWRFGNRTYRVTKAYRIEYEYEQGGTTKKDYILIGYQGAGGSDD